MIGVEYKDKVSTVRGSALVVGVRTGWTMILCLSAEGLYYCTICLGLVVRYTELFQVAGEASEAGLNMLADLIEGKV